MTDTLERRATPLLFFMKAVVKKQVWIPGYTKRNGTVVLGHYATVNVSADHDEHKVVSGNGSFSQKEAHKKLSKKDWFHALPHDHKHAVILKEATKIQRDATVAAQTSTFKKKILAGEKPSRSEWSAFADMPEAKRGEFAATFKEAGKSDAFDAGYAAHRAANPPTETAAPVHAGSFEAEKPAPRVTTAAEKETTHSTASGKDESAQQEPKKVTGAEAKGDTAKLTREQLPAAPEGDEKLAKKVAKIQDLALAGDADSLAAYYDRLLEPKAKDYAKAVVGFMAKREGDTGAAAEEPVKVVGARSEEQLKAAQRRYAESRKVDPSKDSLVTAIAKLGGIKRADATSQWGYGDNDMKGHRVGILPVFSSRGLSIERMGEALHELGYLKTDENGRYDTNELEEHVSNGLGGGHHFTAEGYAHKAEKDYTEQYQEMTARDAEESGFNDLPPELQSAIEEQQDEYNGFSADDLAYFAGRGSMDGMAGTPREAELDFGAEGTGHASFDQADDAARGAAQKPVSREPGEDDEPTREPGSDDDVGDGPKEGDHNADGLVFRNGRWHRDEEPVTVAPATAGAPGYKIPPPPDVAEDTSDFGETEPTPDVVSTSDENKPSDANYRYADTGYIADSKKEQAAERAATMIGRAKKEGARVYATAIDWEALEQNPREAKDLITKSNLFGKVDWHTLRDAGMEPGAGFLVDRIYAAIGQEPTEETTQARQDYVTGLQSLRDRLEACKTAAEVASVLDTLRDEYDGYMLNPDEAARFEEHGQKSHELYNERKVIDAERTVHYNEMQRAVSEKYKVENEIEKRERRKWAPDPKHAQQLAEATAKHEAATKKWGDNIHATKERLEEIDAQRSEHGMARDMIRLGAKARNQLENPMHRAWQLMGDRFLGVIRYRSYKGSDAFQNHVATAKAGKIDWSWLDKEQTRAPKSTQESARFQLQVADTFERVGGRKVTAESTADLKAKFNLRDVQSGNWVLRDFSSAKFHVEQTAAAFADLADLLGAEDDQVSMKGRLAMAFGARGHGKAMAHYEPVHRVINMTKMKGGGALAHEWFHALDNMASEAETGKSGGKDDFATLNPDVLPHGELRDAVIGLRAAMLEGSHYASAPVQYSASDVRVAKRTVDREGAGRVGAMIKGAGNVHDAVRAVDQYLGPKDGQKLKGRYKTQHEDWRRIAAAYYGGKEEGGEIDVRAGRPMSAFAMEARILDNGSSKAYWAGTEEMAARAFQSWVEDSLAAKGRRNDYLSSKADNKFYFDPLTGMQFRPFPEGEERTRINAAFDKFVAALKKSNTLQKAIDRADWTAPTAAQAAAGNYKKPRVKWNGLDLAIENPAGTTRDWGGGKTTMKHDYGYVCQSEGIDGDAVDVYVGPDESAPTVYVVHQRQAGNWDAYDEDKAMLGFDSEEAARAAYLQHYDDPRFLGPITAMPVDEFVSKVRATKGNPAMIKCLILKSTKLSDSMRESIGEVGSKHRAEMPADAFLEGAERKYPVKQKGADGTWHYSPKLLMAAAARARMQGNEELAKRADEIRAKL